MHPHRQWKFPPSAAIITRRDDVTPDWRFTKCDQEAHDMLCKQPISHKSPALGKVLCKSNATRSGTIFYWGGFWLWKRLKFLDSKHVWHMFGSTKVYWYNYFRWLGGGFNFFLIFTPKPGGRFPFWLIVFLQRCWFNHQLDDLDCKGSF